MKKTISLLLSLVMLFSITAGLDFSAYASDDKYIAMQADYTYVVSIFNNENNTSNKTFMFECNESGNYLLCVSRMENSDLQLNYTEFIDANGNGVFDDDERFIDGGGYGLTYCSIVLDLNEGSTYLFTLNDQNLDGIQRTVTLKENNIDKIIYSPLQNEYIDSYSEHGDRLTEFDEEGNEYQYFYYYAGENSGDKVTICYNDGTTKEYICNYVELYGDYDYYWIDLNGNVLDGTVSIYSNQNYSNPWYLGKEDCYVTAEYFGIESQPVKIDIVEHPIQNITYIPVNCELIADEDGFVYTSYDKHNDDGSYIFRDVKNEGDILIIDYKNGKSVKYICKYVGSADEHWWRYCWFDENGEVLDGYVSIFSNESDDNIWIYGNDNCYITAEYMGVKSQQIKIDIIQEHIHNYKIVTIPSSCTERGYSTYTCLECGETLIDDYTDIIDHNYNLTSKTTKASTSKDGKVITTYTCSECKHSYSKTTKTISKIASVQLSKTSYVYDGKVKKPSVTVKDSKGKTIAASNYTVTYSSDRKNVGSYKVTIKFKGNYSGTVTESFTIKPKSTSISKLTAQSKGFTVNWKKQATQTTGYQIQYSTSSNFKNAKIVTVGSNKTTSKKITKLNAKKKYYVRIRTYKTVKVNGKNTKIYSAWSKSKAVTAKK